MVSAAQNKKIRPWQLNPDPKDFAIAIIRTDLPSPP
jgi:hypothetical protein